MKDTNHSFYKRTGFWVPIIITSILAVLIIALNMRFAESTEKVWIKSEGQLRLSNITSSVENNLARAENYANSYAAQLELMLRQNGQLQDKDIDDFIHAQNKMLREKTDGQCFSTYVAYNNRLYIEDFVPDSSFHLTERVWYVGAKKNQGKVYITAPYIDANTQNMCYSVSMLLDDGNTIIGLDFYMDVIQKYIERMNEQIDGISMIVNEGGMIVGHNDASLLGQDYTILKDYKELIEKVFNLYGDYFEYTVQSDHAIKYTVFSDKTTYGWYLIICLPSSQITSGAGTNSLIVTAILVILWLAVLVVFIYFYRRRIRLQQQLSASENKIKSISNKLRGPVAELSQQIQFADSMGEDLKRNLGHLADEIKEDLNNIESLPDVAKQKHEHQNEEGRTKKGSGRYKRYSIAIISVLLLTSVVAVAVNTYTQLNYIDAYMENKGEVYYSQTKSWIDTNITLTNDLALHLGAQPNLYKDYEKAVKYLDDVVNENNDISVAYIVNPAWEHTVIMNNGWEPEDPDWHVEERDWYVDTVLSESGFNISTPYQDEQTGMYCVTFSQIVYDEHQNIVGLIGIDFYMDALIKILGESYTSEGYAFLTDPSYIILNHPSKDYQMSQNLSVSGAESGYRDALVSEKLTLMKDYDGSYVVTLAQREPKAGFTVVTVRKAGLIYGTLILTDFVLVMVFLISIMSVLLITRYMSKQQQKLNHELRLAADKAIAAGTAKSKFLAQMSHEIRTPINAVLGMSELILRESKEDAIISYASNAYNAGNALLSIINDVLDISKIEAGKLEIVESEYDMHSLVSDCYHMTSERAAKKGLQFLVSADETLPSKLYGDMFHLRQIIVNFLTNAIKYTNEGFVELKFERRDSEDGFAMRVSVRDSGIGLTEESMKALFTSFQRFDLERNQSVEGTGLGLSICKQLAELMGGTVEAESVYGKGSTFICTIPQKVMIDEPVGKIELDKQPKRMHPDRANRFTAPSAHILVVDDVEMNLLVFSGLLKEHKLLIDKAQSGAKCLELVQKQKYDVIFMDHMMPEMDGIETFAQMDKIEHLNKETPVVMLTANAISGEREKYLEAGFHSYLTKPVQSDKLEELILELVPDDKIIRDDMQENAEEGGVSGIVSDTAHIDHALGLSYSGDSEEVYLEILKVYVESGDERSRDILRSYDSENWKDYVTYVHALKSTSLTIGARQLSEAAAELEKAGKEGGYDVIKEKTEGLLSLYQEVLTEGEGILGRQRQTGSNDPGEEHGRKEEITKERLNEYAQSFVKAAEHFDSDEILRLCEELCGYQYNGEPLENKVDKIRGAAEDFECDLAGQYAQELFAELMQQ